MISIQNILRNTSHSLKLLSFVVDFNMSCVIESGMADVPYTFICNATGSTSKIDHLVVSDTMFCKAISCNIIDNALHSNHVPVSITFDLDIDYAAISE